MSSDLIYRTFQSEEHDLPDIIALVDQELSEPYNIYTFRYFLQEWPHLAWLVHPPHNESNTHPSHAIATIVCKQDYHKARNRGYIAMLSVDKNWRRRGIARRLIELAVEGMIARGADEIVLETETDNAASLSLYGSMGFIRDRRLYRFYLNGKDAFRLVYPVTKESSLQHPTSSPELQISSLSIPDEPTSPPELPLRPAQNGPGLGRDDGLTSVLEEQESVGNGEDAIREGEVREVTESAT
ncbi:N-alpha-acetyltransferase 30 [Naganishia albida]|nr:N-alpha-acetyltransferase 30 [Naganishia albida]